MTQPTLIRCSFTARTPAPGGGYHYDTVAGMRLATTCPPQVGDVIAHTEGMYRVVARQWTVPQIGSTAWPSTEEAPREALMALVVEPAEGLFADEVVRTEEDTER
ncbi:hypothetical protein [Nonomuraea bangladeshensis]|uniref:hypothetical protein n=1 Tax=Nonomuraea bangladeshensis TaxID=404385 RepID=UPI0031D0A349